MNKQMNKLLILTMISIFILTVPIMVEAGISEPIKTKQYDLVIYDYIITSEFNDIIEEDYDLIVNLTLEEDWHYYLEDREVGDSSAYKDKDDNIHTFFIMEIIEYEPPVTSESESGPNLLDDIINTLTGFSIEELVVIIVIGIIVLWFLSHLRM